MAISSSSSVQQQVIRPAPLHATPSAASNVHESWECCQPCNACPHCADVCGNADCPACSSKSMSNPQPCFGCEKDHFFTLCQVRRHDHSASAWLVVGDSIYDATSYIARHPGGTESILKRAGGKADCQVDFDFHSNRAQKMWKRYKVGKLCPCAGDPQQDFGTGEHCVIS